MLGRTLWFSDGLFVGICGMRGTGVIDPHCCSMQHKGTHGHTALMLAASQVPISSAVLYLSLRVSNEIQRPRHMHSLASSPASTSAQTLEVH